MQWTSVVFAYAAHIPPLTISRRWICGETHPLRPQAHMVWGGPSSSPTNSQPLTWRVNWWLRPGQTSQSLLLATEIGSKWVCIPCQTWETRPFRDSYWNDWNRQLLFLETDLRRRQPGAPGQTGTSPAQPKKDGGQRQGHLGTSAGSNRPEGQKFSYVYRFTSLAAE